MTLVVNRDQVGASGSHREIYGHQQACQTVKLMFALCDNNLDSIRFHVQACYGSWDWHLQCTSLPILSLKITPRVHRNDVIDT